MFDYLAGKLTHASPTAAIIDIQGIGYRVHTPLNTYAKLPQIKSDVLFYVSLIVREDSQKLFGFLMQRERDLFEHLITISGIGPKTALALIGHMPLEELQGAISRGNASVLSKIPGIGKKTAERLIVEMRDKICAFCPPDVHASKNLEYSLRMADAISALINLGYNAAQAQKAVRAARNAVDKEPELASLITLALRCM